MSANERKKEILKLLKERDYISIHELSQIFQVSNVTIRANLADLEQENLIRKVHGGVVAVTQSQENEVDWGYPQQMMYHRKLLSEEKRKIAEIAVSLIRENDVIYLDHTTTCQYIANQIAECTVKCYVITNSLSIISILKNTKRCILIGGEYDQELNSFVGETTKEFLKLYHINKAFFSPKGFSVQSGPMDFPNANISFEKICMQNADQVLIVADHTKFDFDGLIVLAYWKEVDSLITDQDPPPEYQKVMEENDVRLYD
ncbi:MAG: DeoR/GlpR family DNA-binding transcription regulator [Candidatus Merdivicinus sp.]|jgi:DeoR/GlpR family transcriptional regulator of sugar metabolism